MADPDRLLVELDRERTAVHEALADVDLELATVPGVVGDWSVRDLVHHLAAWCEHGSEALRLAADGRGGSFAYGGADTDAMNERFLAEARTLSPAQALAREEEAFAAFRMLVAGLDADRAAERLGNGDTVADVVRYDGPDHYREHAEHLRAWFGPDPDEDDDA